MEFSTIRVSKRQRKQINAVREKYGLDSNDEAVAFLLIRAGENE